MSEEININEALQLGIEAHKAGNAREADKYYTAILKAQPNHPDANHNMGVLAVGIGKMEQSLPFFKKALEENPKIEQFWISYIDALMRLEKTDDAKAALKQAYENGASGEAFNKFENKLNNVPDPKASQALDPPQDQLQPLFNLYNQGQLQPALHQAQQLLTQFPNSTILHNICGATNMGLKQYDEAVSSFSRAIKINPNYPDAYNNMGIALKDQGKLDEAIKAYEKAITLKPDYAEAYSNMGSALKEIGQFKEAIAAYEKAITLKPDYADAHNNMGNALKEIGQFDKAISSYQKAITLNPNYAEFYNNMGSVLQKQKEFVQAIENYKQAIMINPK